MAKAVGPLTEVNCQSEERKLAVPRPGTMPPLPQAESVRRKQSIDASLIGVKEQNPDTTNACLSQMPVKRTELLSGMNDFASPFLRDYPKMRDLASPSLRVHLKNRESA